MKRPMFVCALLLTGVAALAAQQASSNQYEGVSNPPPNDEITTPDAQPQPEAKPSPAKPMTAAPAAPAAQTAPAAQLPQESAPLDPAMGFTRPDSGDGTDAGIVKVESANGSQPALNQRAMASDPDGDIVHPVPLPPGTLMEGTVIRVRLLERISTNFSQDGDSFRTQVASDVVSNGQVALPAGAEIDGVVTHVTTGHFGGRGSMSLQPQAVILPDGSHYRLYAQVTAAPGSNTRVGNEGTVEAGSRTKKDEIEYGGGVGVGLVAGAALGGPAGALAGSLVGAGAVTLHLLMDHPQATLDKGPVLDFTLTEPLRLVAATPNSGQ
jgi:hypothetical protein